MQSENDTYYLLCAWLLQSPHAAGDCGKLRVNINKRLVKHLRFHHMSPDFLGTVVPWCPLAIAHFRNGAMSVVIRIKPIRVSVGIPQQG